MPVKKHAVLLGARSIVAPYLLARLAGQGYAVECVVRQTGAAPVEPSSTLCWTVLDAGAPGAWTPRRGAMVFSLLPLWLLPPLLPNLSGARQIIAFGSTSAVAKAASSNPGERGLAQRLRDAEGNLTEACSEMGVPWTLLRPTLVYGGGRDRNISAIAGVIRRFGFFALAAPGRGKRQPVHADDLASAALSAVGNSAARDAAFDLPGGETLTYREMVQRIFLALGRRPRILLLPETVLAVAVDGLRRLGLVDGTAETVRRMNRDLTADGAPARIHLGYRPRDFRPELPEER